MSGAPSEKTSRAGPRMIEQVFHLGLLPGAHDACDGVRVGEPHRRKSPEALRRPQVPPAWKPHAGMKNSTVWRIPHRASRRLCSCENPMHEPSRRFLRCVVQALPVKPITSSRGVLDAEIIACRSITIPVPPFWRDAFRSFGFRDPMRDTPPAEMNGRTFRDFGCRDFDWLRLAKKTDGTVGVRFFQPCLRFAHRIFGGTLQKAASLQSHVRGCILDRNRPQNSLFP